MLSGNNNVTLSSQFTEIHVLFLFIELILFATSLVVMVTLYVNLSASTAGSAAVLPAQCFTYTTDSDSTRLYTHASSCCGADNSLAAGWYRFTGGGTRLVTTQLSTASICGTSYPGWWNGTLPMTTGATTVGNVCFYTGDSCSNSLSPIIATNCGSYYVFYLVPAPCCLSYRYCTTP
ncbi:unnamed protein product [Rotaria sp. Silwood1]|nr:unnamed protein product [Rotaria sp. Silwood1]CAF1600491.1 unnamed protein product [Rotaria sp. Silwood1]CAF3704925.1 unnamed protein product [Rotaria sp. Silwood1]CAF3706791.1 unnamed protein product [Rotaria sp. Silwood1]CAF4932806.1 unnamed protein product [Rotaria sp. Silwood1]